MYHGTRTQENVLDGIRSHTGNFVAPSMHHHRDTPHPHDKIPIFHGDCPHRQIPIQGQSCDFCEAGTITSIKMESVKKKLMGVQSCPLAWLSVDVKERMPSDFYRNGIKNAGSNLQQSLEFTKGQTSTRRQNAAARRWPSSSHARCIDRLLHFLS